MAVAFYFFHQIIPLFLILFLIVQMQFVIFQRRLIEYQRVVHIKKLVRAQSLLVHFLLETEFVCVENERARSEFATSRLSMKNTNGQKKVEINWKFLLLLTGC